MTGLVHIRGLKRRPDPLLLAASDADVLPLSVPVSFTTSERDIAGRDARVELRTRAIVSRLFGASQPVDNRKEMCGRTEELKQLTSIICDNGLHGLIFGPRGSGKTSLSRVFGDYADERGMIVIYNSCAGGATFSDLLTPYLDDLDSASFGLDRQKFQAQLTELRRDINPRTLAGFLSGVKKDDVLFILDEFDRIESISVKAQMAILVKLLADTRSAVRLLFVGISDDVDDLIGSHASVRRHLTAIAVQPLADEQVDSFIRRTGGNAGMDFTDNARRMLCWLVRGSPYHMRLFSLNAALSALDAHEREVDEDKVADGLKTAYQSWRMMNMRDADLFFSLVRDDQLTPTVLEIFAGVAARHIEFDRAVLTEAMAGKDVPPAMLDTALDRLSPALKRQSPQNDRLAFEDVLAPQFLLAASVIARSRRHVATAPVKEKVAE